MTSEIHENDRIATARITGVWYLLLAISGMLGFLMLHQQIYVASDPGKTLTNLTDHESVARLRLVFELLIVVAQALAAVWFFKLFKDINHFAAWALAAWGMMNAGIIMVSAVAMGSALGVVDSTLAESEKITLIHLLNLVIKNCWAVGSLFFGLWLIPMGYIITSSRCMPVWLGRVLIAGGFGYLISTFLNYAGLSGVWNDVLVMPATIGEFWIVGYLLIFGIRPKSQL